jgi:cytosol alanyl aminopeptidase
MPSRPFQRLTLGAVAALLIACERQATDAPTAHPTAPASTVAFASPKETAPLARLPAGVRPVHYNLVIEIVPSRDEFAGTVEIAVDLDKSQDVIWMHGQRLRAKQAAVRPEGKAPLPALFEQVHASGVAALRLPRAVGPGRVTIHIDYEAPFGTRGEGLYLVHRGGKTYAFTQFESVSARGAFPSFDEPAFKAPVDLTLFVPKGTPTIANTREIERRAWGSTLDRVTFATTDKMPTYLVAFATGPFDVADGPPVPPNAIRKRPLPLRVVTVRERGPELNFWLEESRKIVTRLEEYVGVEFPYDKLDMLAVPDKLASMENAGAIMFREGGVLIDPRTASIEQKRQFYELVTHEIGHQWFGDMVTMPWWDDLWEKESFATWIGTKLTHKAHPELLVDVAALERAHLAMRLDSLASARQIRQEVKDADGIANAYDTLTYQKGAKVVEMFERWVGPEVFRRGLSRYLEKHRAGTASVTELLQAVSQAANKDVATPFLSFLMQPGFPNIEVDLVCKKDVKATLRQSRFLAAGAPAESKALWKVPVCVRYGAGKQVKEACTLLDGRTGELPLGDVCPTWVFPNADGAGYYRFSLPAPLAARVSTVGFGALSAKERLAFADSIRGAYERASAPLPEVMAQLAPLARDGSHAVAAVVVDVLQDLARASEGPALADVRAYGASLFAKPYDDLGWQPPAGRRESEERTLLRQTVIQYLALGARDPRVRKEALARGLSWVREPERAPPMPKSLLGVALAVAVQDGDPGVFDELVRRLRYAKDDATRVAMLKAVGSAKRVDQAARARALVLDTNLKTSEWIHPLEAQFAEPETKGAAWAFYLENFDALTNKMQRRRASNVIAHGNKFCDAARAAELTKLVTPRLDAIAGSRRVLATTTEAIHACVARKAAYAGSASGLFARGTKRASAP